MTNTIMTNDYVSYADYRYRICTKDVGQKSF